MRVFYYILADVLFLSPGDEGALPPVHRQLAGVGAHLERYNMMHCTLHTAHCTLHTAHYTYPATMAVGVNPTPRTGAVGLLAGIIGPEGRRNYIKAWPGTGMGMGMAIDNG